MSFSNGLFIYLPASLPGKLPFLGLTVSQITYTVLVETLNPAHSLTVYDLAWITRTLPVCKFQLI